MEEALRMKSEMIAAAQKEARLEVERIEKEQATFEQAWLMKREIYQTALSSADQRFDAMEDRQAKEPVVTKDHRV